MPPLPSPLAMVLRPSAAWTALRAADPSWLRTFLRHALPLSLLPALAWPLGQAAAGDLSWTLRALVGLSLSTLALSVAVILALAAALCVLAPAFEARRNWNRSVAVAAYAATPVLLSGALLLMPVLIMVSVIACLHACALCYGGVQAVLGCPERDAAFFVAAAGMLSLLASLVLGGLCSAAGVL